MFSWIDITRRPLFPQPVRLCVSPPQVLAWLGAELYSTEAATVRRQLVASQSTYQDVALSLALHPKAGPQAAELAASALLRFKGLAVEEEAFVARLEIFQHHK